MNNQYIAKRNNLFEEVLQIINTYKRGNQLLIDLKIGIDNNQLRATTNKLVKIDHDVKACRILPYKIWQITLGDKLKHYQEELEKKILEAEKLISQANSLIRSQNPLDIKSFIRAVKLYQSSLLILNEPKTQAKLSRIKYELSQRQIFANEYNQGKLLAKDLYFTNALKAFKRAEELFNTAVLTANIRVCEEKIKHEEKYANNLKTAKKYIQNGFLEKALQVLIEARKIFARQDSTALIYKLENTLKGYEEFCKGLNSEKLQNYEQAAVHYNSSLKLLPSTNMVEDTIYTRLAFSHFRSRNLNLALQHLENSSAQSALYLKGFIYFQHSDFNKAFQAWISLNHPDIKKQSKLLKQAAESHKLKVIHQIQIYIEAQNLHAAKSESQKYLDEFGEDDYPVSINLEQHIQPCLEITNWMANDHSAILPDLEKQLQQNFTLTNIHNWAIAAYFAAQDDKSHIPKMIAAIFTMVANLEKNQNLKMLPWLTDEVPDLNQLKQDLISLVQNTLDRLKDEDLPSYLQGRDLYRVETHALRLNAEKEELVPKIGNIYLTPGCSRYFPNVLSQTRPHESLLGTLYTAWGTAIAACLDGDIERAIQIQPRQTATNSLEKLAVSTITYYRGKHALQSGKWREAQTHLKGLASIIQKNREWQKEIDELGTKIRRELDNNNDHINFAEFWHHITGNPVASAYLAEYKAEDIRERIVEEKISLSQAKRELQKLRTIDKNNPLVEDLIEKIEFQEELEDLVNVMENSSIETWVSKALRSNHKEIHRRTATVLMDILMNGIERRSLDINEMKKILRWLRQLSPDDQNIRDMATQLKVY
jgi:hypothetical protein